MIKKNTKPNNERCAPTKNYNEGSCFTYEQLYKMAEAYNKNINNPDININKSMINLDNPSKRDLVYALTDRLKNVCKDQLCWLTTEIVKNISDDNIKEDIMKNTFRPKGPGLQGNFKWLNTTNINNIMEQYEKKYPDFKFFGAVPIDFDELPQLGIKDMNFDELINDNITRIGFVFNLDRHNQSGSHWVALFCNLCKTQIYFFDSYGTRPKKEIRVLIDRIAKWCYENIKKKKLDVSDNDTDVSYMTKDKKNKYEKLMGIDYNRSRHQYGNSECGVYSVNFILRLLKGESFENVSKNITTDDKVNACREEYFTL
jgi:hypothetical protein